MTSNGAPAPARSNRISVRVTDAGREAIAKRATDSGYSESDVVRMLMSYALQHMPPIPAKGIRL